MFNESFWVAFSIIILFALIFKAVKSSILNMIGNRIKEVENKFNEIFTIHEESEKLLQNYQNLFDNAAKEIEAINSSAELEIKRLKEKFEQDLIIKLQARTNIIGNKIKNIEAVFLTNLRMKTVNYAIAAVEKILISEQKIVSHQVLVESSIDAIESQFK
jgi:F0F1-type ATP synthase membrane subunit b/b'